MRRRRFVIARTCPALHARRRVLHRLVAMFSTQRSATPVAAAVAEAHLPWKQEPSHGPGTLRYLPRTSRRRPRQPGTERPAPRTRPLRTALPPVDAPAAHALAAGVAVRRRQPVRRDLLRLRRAEPGHPGARPRAGGGGHRRVLQQADHRVPATRRAGRRRIRQARSGHRAPALRPGRRRCGAGGAQAVRPVAGRPQAVHRGQRRARRQQGRGERGHDHLAAGEERLAARLRPVPRTRPQLCRPRAPVARPGGGAGQLRRDAPEEVRPDRAGATAESGQGGRQGRRGWPRGRPEQHSATGQVQPRPDPAGPRRQARSGDRPLEGSRDHHRGARPAQEEQPGADRRARRRQDRHRRRPGPAHGPGRGAGGAARQAPGRTEHQRHGRRRQVPRRVRGTPQAGDGRTAGGAERDHPVHRRGAHHRRCRPGRRRRRAGRGQRAEAGDGARRDEPDRRHHPQRVPEVHREGRRAGAALPAGVRPRADGGADHLHPPWPARQARRPPQGDHPRRGLRRRRRAVRPLHRQPFPAGQGHRPDRPGRRPRAHRQHLAAGRDPGTGGRAGAAQARAGLRRQPQVVRRGEGLRETHPGTQGTPRADHRALAAVPGVEDRGGAGRGHRRDHLQAHRHPGHRTDRRGARSSCRWKSACTSG